MHRLVLITEQLEETKCLILIGGVPQLRMALLLLDNTVELLMHRAVGEMISSNRLWEQLLKQWLYHHEQANTPERKQEIATHIEEVRKHIIPASQIRSIQKYFDEKIRFLVRQTKIDNSVGDVLSAIHRYRNLAYHQEKLRKETIRPVVLLLFEIACDLFVSLYSGSMGISSEDNFSDFEARYGLKGFQFMGPEGRQTITRKLREGLPLESSKLSIALSDHLEQRLEDIMSALDFIAENTRWGDDTEWALKRVQFWKAMQDKVLSDEEFTRFVPQYNMDALNAWRTKIQVLRTKQETLEMFGEFARLEQMLEPIEESIYAAAAEVDHAIQMEIDRLRGK